MARGGGCSPAGWLWTLKASGGTLRPAPSPCHPTHPTIFSPILSEPDLQQTPESGEQVAWGTGKSGGDRFQDPQPQATETSIWQAGPGTERFQHLPLRKPHPGEIGNVSAHFTAQKTELPSGTGVEGGRVSGWGGRQWSWTSGLRDDSAS